MPGTVSEAKGANRSMQSHCPQRGKVYKGAGGVNRQLLNNVMTQVSAECSGGPRLLTERSESKDVFPACQQVSCVSMIPARLLRGRSRKRRK